MFKQIFGSRMFGMALALTAIIAVSAGTTALMNTFSGRSFTARIEEKVGELKEKVKDAVTPTSTTPTVTTPTAAPTSSTTPTSTTPTSTTPTVTQQRGWLWSTTYVNNVPVGDLTPAAQRRLKAGLPNPGNAQLAVFDGK